MSSDLHPAAPRTSRSLAVFLGPAFVAAVAYVDPGNVAANLTAGAQYGYLLVWVLVTANLMAMVVQYLSAKLGVVTGEAIPSLLASRLSRPARIAFYAQAQVVAIATDLAEVIGGAIALNILFEIPLVPAGLIIGAVSIVMLAFRDRHGKRAFEHVIIGLLLVITIGFMAGLFVNPPHASDVVRGLLPRFSGHETVMLAASMLGATVMPHAIYLHSSLVRTTPGPDSHTNRASTTAHLESDSHIRRILKATKVDVTLSLIVAGGVNIAMLLLAAVNFTPADNVDTIEAAHATISHSLGTTIGTFFAVGLLVSGLASASVGAQAGAEITRSLLHIRLPLIAQRLITLVPSLAILACGAEPTNALVISQVVLSLGIPFAIIPLVRFTSNDEIMGDYVNRSSLRLIATVISFLIVALNIGLVVTVVTAS